MARVNDKTPSTSHKLRSGTPNGRSADSTVSDGGRLSRATKAAQTSTGLSKYGNRKTPLTFDGQTWLFDSKREAEAALGLLIRQQAGEVRDLYFQVPYRLEVEDVLICRYVADFVYDERCPQRDTSMGEAWVAVVADAKGYRTDMYRLKKKLMKAIHGIDVVEL